VSIRINGSLRFAAIDLKDARFAVVMKNVAYQLEHSVEADVSPSFAWNWRTDIGNWDDPPAQFQLDGRFASGSWGTTLLPGREPLRWQIRDVQPGAAFVIDCRWTGLSYRLSGCLPLCRTTEPGSRSALPSRATTQRPT
jgi:hypothetical protein